MIKLNGLWVPRGVYFIPQHMERGGEGWFVKLYLWKRIFLVIQMIKLNGLLEDVILQAGLLNCISGK